MRIVDVNNNEIQNPDLSIGYFKKDKIFVKHHEAIEKVDEQWHYEVVAEYPNGGRDVKKVIDVVGVEAKDAWDEYEDVKRYIKFTEEELDKINQEKLDKVTTSQRLDKIEEMISKLTEYFDGYKSISENEENNENEAE